MKRIIDALKTVNYKLWIAILTLMILPSIYLTVRIYFLGQMPNEWGVNIASQLQYVNLFYEVIQEALILPLFFIMGKVIHDKVEFQNRTKSGLLVTSAIYIFASLIIVIFAREIVVFMAQDQSLVSNTVDYIRLETFAALFSTLTRFMMLVLILMKKDKLMYIILGFQMVTTILLDTFLVSSLSFSLNLGVNGIALTNIIVNIMMLTIAFILVKREGINIFSKEKMRFDWLKDWFSVGKFSGLESLLRNLAFSFMIIRMVNLVSEQGNYWIANNFIWTWLLLPGLALADLVKQEISENKDNISSKTFGYIVLTSIFALIWLLSIPLWKPFLQYVLNVNEYETVFNIVLIQTGFYITFLFNSCIFDSTFYGRGKTKYMLIQSLIIDGVYYGTMFVLYLTGIFVPTLLGISLMFGIGMTLDFIPTLIIYVYMLKKENIKIQFKFI